MTVFRCGICWWESTLPDIERFHESLFEWNDLQRHDHGTEDYWKVEVTQ